MGKRDYIDDRHICGNCKILTTCPRTTKGLIDRNMIKDFRAVRQLHTNRPFIYVYDCNGFIPDLDFIRDKRGVEQ